VDRHVVVLCHESLHLCFDISFGMGLRKDVNGRWSYVGGPPVSASSLERIVRRTAAVCSAEAKARRKKQALLVLPDGVAVPPRESCGVARLPMLLGSSNAVVSVINVVLVVSRHNLLVRRGV
jgi:hypothetical protein